jgi:glutamate racemase
MTPKVLIFDSGVGGLSILAELQTLLPGCQFVFACDNEAFPYGTKEEATLLTRVDQVLKALINKVDPDIVVVACNSASTLVLPQIRSHFSKPVVGVVPAIKPAAQLSKSKVIGLLATPGTVARSYTKQLINDFAADCKVISVGSSELVHIAEQKLRGEKIDTLQLNTILKPFQQQPELDTIVLACTHFPLVQQELATTLDKPVNWIDSGEAIARRVHSLLPEHSEVAINHRHITAIFTEQTQQVVQLSKGLAQFGCTNIEFILV